MPEVGQPSSKVGQVKKLLGLDGLHSRLVVDHTKAIVELTDSSGCSDFARSGHDEE